MKRVGLLGGSFNPAHDGHRHISVQALRLLGLDEVWWLVSPQNPLKPVRGMAPLADRLVSARRAKRHPRIRASTIETELGTRYAVETVAALRRRFPQTRFIWLMGADNLGQLPHWRDWRRLTQLVPIAVFPRPGYGSVRSTAPAMAWLQRGRHASAAARHWQTWELPAIVKLNIRLSPQSASRLRARNPDWFRDPALLPPS